MNFLFFTFPWSEWIPSFRGDILAYLADWLSCFWAYMGSIYPFGSLVDGASNAFLSDYTLRELLADVSVFHLLFSYFTGFNFEDSEEYENFASEED